MILPSRRLRFQPKYAEAFGAEYLLDSAQPHNAYNVWKFFPTPLGPSNNLRSQPSEQGNEAGFFFRAGKESTKRAAYLFPKRIWLRGPSPGHQRQQHHSKAVHIALLRQLPGGHVLGTQIAPRAGDACEALPLEEVQSLSYSFHAGDTSAVEGKTFTSNLLRAGPRWRLCFEVEDRIMVADIEAE